jgi:hypothetical protein
MTDNGDGTYEFSPISSDDPVALTAEDEQTITYTPVHADIGKVLGIQLNTNPNSIYTDNMRIAMAAAVTKATYAAPEKTDLTVDSASGFATSEYTNEIKITTVDDVALTDFPVKNLDADDEATKKVQFAIAAHADDEDAAAIVEAGLTYVETADFTQLDGEDLTLNTAYDIYVKYVDTYAADDAAGNYLASDYLRIPVKTAKISIEPEEGEDPIYTLELTGDLKEDSEAGVTVKTKNSEGETVDADITAWDATYKWYLLNDDGEKVDGDDDEENGITPVYTTASVTFTSDDVGHKFLVEVAPGEDSNYSGTLTLTTDAVSTKGYTVSGQISSYNSALEITYALYKLGEDGETYTLVRGTADEDGKVTGVQLIAATEIPNNDGVLDFTATQNSHTQEFKIENVENGTYKLVIMKSTHIDFTITNLVVSDGDVDLTTHSNARLQTITMGSGDADNNGLVNADDVNTVATDSRYGGTTMGEYKVDVDGNGFVNADDINFVTGRSWYGSSDNSYFVVSAS